MKPRNGNLKNRTFPRARHKFQRHHHSHLRMGSQRRKKPQVLFMGGKWRPKCIDAQAYNSNQRWKFKTSSTQAPPVQTQVDRSHLQRRTDLPQSLNQFPPAKMKGKKLLGMKNKFRATTGTDLALSSGYTEDHAASVALSIGG